MRKLVLAALLYCAALVFLHDSSVRIERPEPLPDKAVLTGVEALELKQSLLAYGKLVEHAKRRLVRPWQAYAADYTNVVQAELIGITNVATTVQSISSEYSTGSGSAFQIISYVFLDFAPESTNTNGTELRIELNETAGGDNDKWRTVWSTITSTAVVTTNGIDGTEAIGQTVIEESVTSGLTNGNGQIVFIKDNGTLADSEWVKLVAASSNVSFTIQDGLRVAKDSSDAWFNEAEHFAVRQDLGAIVRLRAVCNNNHLTGGDTVNWRAAHITATVFE